MLGVTDYWITGIFFNLFSLITEKVMSSKAIAEIDGKRLLQEELNAEGFVKPQFVGVNEETNLEHLISSARWLKEQVYISFLGIKYSNFS